MKKVLFLSLFLLIGLSSFLNAQCSASQSPFAQNPSTQASIVASADDSIVELIDDATAQIHYYRRIENPWDGSVVWVELVFDSNSSSFVDTDSFLSLYDNDVLQEPARMKKDSCKQEPHATPRKTNPKPKRQPRRSSRVKIANF